MRANTERAWTMETEDRIMTLADEAWASTAPWFLNYVPDRDAEQHGEADFADLWHNGGPGGSIASIHCVSKEGSGAAHYIEAAVNGMPLAIQELRRLREWKHGAEGAAAIARPPREGAHTEAAYLAHRTLYEGSLPDGAYAEGADLVSEVDVRRRAATETMEQRRQLETELRAALKRAREAEDEIARLNRLCVTPYTPELPPMVGRIVKRRSTT